MTLTTPQTHSDTQMPLRVARILDVARDIRSFELVQPDGSELPFEVQPFRKHCLINGLDDIGLTLAHKDEIKAFEAARLAAKPWLAHTMVG